jgi:anti-anti-sigma factor
MTANVSNEGDVYTIAITGRIDTISAPELEEEFNRIEPKAEKVIFDMTGVDYISSAGMRMIVAVHRKMASKGGLVLRGLKKNVRAIINLTGFSKVLTIEE